MLGQSSSFYSLGLFVAKPRFGTRGQAIDDSMKGDADREITIFTEALKVSPQERDAFLERSCDGDEDLRRKVEGLLRAHGRLGNFLEEPPAGAYVD